MSPWRPQGSQAGHPLAGRRPLSRAARRSARSCYRSIWCRAVHDRRPDHDAGHDADDRPATTPVAKQVYAVGADRATRRW